MHKIVGYLGLLMGVIFTGIGGFIAIFQPLIPISGIYDFDWTFIKDNAPALNIIVGLLFIAYGIYRLYRSYNIIKNK